MIRLNHKIGILFVVLITIVFSCDPDEKNDLSHISYAPTPYNLNLPSHFPDMYIPSDNPLTQEGILLGRHIFYDPILSIDSSISCASCHKQELNFADGLEVSIGVYGKKGIRSSMPLINVGFVNGGLFWDGRVKTLEEQSLHPVEDPIEMGEKWPNVIKKLQNHPTYPQMFRQAFGITSKYDITKEHVAKAIAQFERTLVSKDSKFDKVSQGLDFYTDLELMGLGIFLDDDPDLPDSECGHCHNLPLSSSDGYFNNGLISSSTLEGFPDLGRGKITTDRASNGMFRTPTLRNINYSAPYMHQGQLKSFDEVFAHYIGGGKSSPNKDVLITPLRLSPTHRLALKKFIETFEDTTFLTNPNFSSPFQ